MSYEEVLRKRAADMSDELVSILEGDQDTIGVFPWGPPRGSTETDHQGRWDAERLAQNLASQKLSNRYGQVRGKVLALFDALEAAGLIKGSQREHFVSARTLEISEAASIFRAIGGGWTQPPHSREGPSEDGQWFPSSRAPTEAEKRAVDVEAPAAMSAEERALRDEAASFALELERIVAEDRVQSAFENQMPHSPQLAAILGEKPVDPDESWEATLRAAMTAGQGARVAYSQKRGRALDLFDRLDMTGLIRSTQRRFFEDPVNPLGIVELAAVLGAIGHGSTKPPHFMDRSRA